MEQPKVDPVDLLREARDNVIAEHWHSGDWFGGPAAVRAKQNAVADRQAYPLGDIYMVTKHEVPGLMRLVSEGQLQACSMAALGLTTMALNGAVTHGNMLSRSRSYAMATAALASAVTTHFSEDFESGWTTWTVDDAQDVATSWNDGETQPEHVVGMFDEAIRLLKDDQVRIVEGPHTVYDLP